MKPYKCFLILGFVGIAILAQEKPTKRARRGRRTQAEAALLDLQIDFPTHVQEQIISNLNLHHELPFLVDYLLERSPFENPNVVTQAPAHQYLFPMVGEIDEQNTITNPRGITATATMTARNQGQITVNDHVFGLLPLSAKFAFNTIGTHLIIAQPSNGTVSIYLLNGTLLKQIQLPAQFRITDIKEENNIVYVKGIDRPTRLERIYIYNPTIMHAINRLFDPRQTQITGNQYYILKLINHAIQQEQPFVQLQLTQQQTLRQLLVPNFTAIWNLIHGYIR